MRNKSLDGSVTMGPSYFISYKRANKDKCRLEINLAELGDIIEEYSKLTDPE